MGLLETFEHYHRREFYELERVSLTNQAFKTPDGRGWCISDVVRGWTPRISDHWAFSVLHYWVARDRVKVRHLELPCGLQAHNPSDPAWAFIEREYGPGEREVEHAMLGRADFGADGLMVEFGTVTPAKFTINVGTEMCDHMVVPYSSPYAFVFTPNSSTLLRRARPDVDRQLNLGLPSPPAVIELPTHCPKCKRPISDIERAALKRSKKSWNHSHWCKP